MNAQTGAGWAERGERSNRFTLRLMSWIATTLGRPVARLLLHPIALYFWLFAPGPRRNGLRFLRRALEREPSWRERYAQFHAFASVVLDRLYFVRGRLADFDLQVTGADLVDATLAEGRGAFLLGAHIGSFEALHAFGASRPGLRVAMVMYPDNARMIHAVLQAVAPQFELGIIAIGQPGSTLKIRDWLDGGGLAGLLGDRFLSGDTATVTLPFLGATARFTDGPLRLAQVLKRRVIFMVALYRGGARYELRFETLADFSQAGQPLAAALAAYVARLEALAREAPDNWFNFHDYWLEDVPH